MKSLKNIHLFTFLILLICVGVTSSHAAGIVVIEENNHIQNIVDVASSGELRFTVLNLLDKVMRFIRLVLNGVALLAMLYVGFLWVTSMGDEEKISNGKNRIILIVLGLFLINIPEALYRIFTGSEYDTSGFGRKVGDVGGQLRDSGNTTSISVGSEESCNFLFCPQNVGGIDIDSIIPMLEITMLIVAVVMFTIGGFRMLLGGSEESAETAKKRIGYGVVALLITGFLEILYKAIYFQSYFDRGDDKIEFSNTAMKAIFDVLVKGAKFFIYLAGPIAIISIIIGGYYFITSGGDEERTDKGKKILMYTFFATIMLLLGYTFLIEIVGLRIF